MLVLYDSMTKFLERQAGEPETESSRGDEGIPGPLLMPGAIKTLSC